MKLYCIVGLLALAVVIVTLLWLEPGQPEGES